MILTTLLLLIAIASVLAWLNWRKSSRFVYFISVALFVGTGCGPLAVALLAGLQTGYVEELPADSTTPTIVVLGAGTEQIGNKLEVPAFAYGRIVKAAELYFGCRRHLEGCKILISGGDPQRHGASEASVYAVSLQRLGADPRDFILEERSLNTWQNAEFSATLLRARRIDRVVLVTSGIHLRRSSLFFEHFDIHATPVRADYAQAAATAIPTSYNMLLSDLAVHEYIGLARYYVYERLRWNVAAGNGTSAIGR